MHRSGRAPAYLGHGVAAREARRRRTLVGATLALTLLSLAPVFAHHLEHQAAAVSDGTAHFGALCGVALQQLLSPVHTAFHLVLLLGIVYACWDRIVHIRRARRILALLDARSPVPGELWWRAAVAAGVDPRIVRIVDGISNPAFTAGWLAPRVYLSSRLASALSFDELAAVLSHEGAHTAARDPLRLSVFRFVGCVFFWIPVFRRLADDVADETEILADDRAIAARAPSADPLVLASALVTVASWTAATQPRPPRSTAARSLVVPGAVGFSGRDLLVRRVRRLAGEEMPATSHLTRRSVAGAIGALMLVWASGIAVARPVAAQSASRIAATAARPSPLAMHMDCTRHNPFALLHIFCTHDSQRCPLP